MKVYLTATLKSKPEFLEDVTSILHTMVEESRKEPTCLKYDLHQGIEDKTQFVFWEIWESKEALEQHNQQHYIQAFREIVPEKLQTVPEVFLLDKI